MNDKEMVEKARCAVTANARKRTIAVVDRTLNKEFGPFDKVRKTSGMILSSCKACSHLDDYL